MIADGPITQIAWVTDDIAATETLLRGQFGSGPWTRIPDVQFDREHSRLRGEPTEFTAHISLAYAGELQLELIQPVAGQSVHTQAASLNPVACCAPPSAAPGCVVVSRRPNPGRLPPPPCQPPRLTSLATAVD